MKFLTKRFWPIWLVLTVTVVALMTSSAVLALPSRSVPGSFRVVGNRVLKPNGTVYIPEGISIYGGLEDTDYAENLANIDAQIKAAALYWHTNTIRLQVAESNLLTGLKTGQPYNLKFLNELKREVALARSLNQAVVINDQTEFTNNTPAPTAMTVRFWQIMSETFGNQPYIIFDLFNEPRLDSRIVHQNSLQSQLIRRLLANQIIRGAHKHHPRHTVNNSVWHIWKYGGSVNGREYVGMQSLVNQIRKAGANNLIWAEGLFWGQSLPTSAYLLSGSNIEYAYHHIDLNHVSDWTFIGRFASRQPVVDGEWSQYQSPWQECYARAPKTVPRYLAYLKTRGIGLVAWSLQSGSLLKGDPHVIPANNNSPADPKSAQQLQTPSRFIRKYRCDNQFGQGAGELIKRYFSQNSVPL